MARAHAGHCIAVLSAKFVPYNVIYPELPAWARKLAAIRASASPVLCLPP
jgi:hypothetical protein